MHDIYLGGVNSPEWRKIFKSKISQDITIFDPYIEKLSTTEKDKTEQIAREFYFLDYCSVVVFYFNSQSTKSARVQLGDAVGKGRQVIVCLDGKVSGKKFLKQYCDYRGVMLAESLDDLILDVEELINQLALCNK